MKQIFYLFVLFSLTQVNAQTVAAPESTTQFGKKNKLEVDDRPAADFYGVLPQNLMGGGAGFALFSPAISVGTGAIRIGGDLYFSNLDRKRLSNVPLADPVGTLGKVKLNENLFSLNLVARYELPWNEIVSPYIDGFVGLRNVHTNLNIRQNSSSTREDESNKIMDEFNSLHYGLGAGLLFNLWEDARLNVGVVYSQSYMQGSIYNVRSAAVNGDMIVMDKKLLASDYLMFKVGFTVLLDRSSFDNSSCHCSPRLGGRGTVIGMSRARKGPASVKIGRRVGT